MTATLNRKSDFISRRLLAADGYLDLNMPADALAELDRIEDPQAFTPSVYYLRGVTLQALGRIGQAIPYLEEAARLIPAPLSRFAWKSLSECYAAEGDVSMAELARMVAESTEMEDETVDPLAEDLNIVQPPSTRPKYHAKNKTLDGE